MPVPKRKTSKSRRDMRQASKFIRPQMFTHCSNCEYPLIGHQVCQDCGFYKGRKVMTTKRDRNASRLEARAATQRKAESQKDATQQ